MLYQNQTLKIMKDLHDPNNPDYFKNEEENELTFNEVMKELPESYHEVIQEEISISQIEANVSRKRIANIRNEIKELIEISEQTKNEFITLKLKKLLEI